MILQHRTSEYLRELTDEARQVDLALVLEQPWQAVLNRTESAA